MEEKKEQGLISQVLVLNLERYLLARKETEKTDEDIQDLIDRARFLKGMKKIEWKPIDK